ncbi:MAG: MarC family protein [Thermoplasmatales archaeon]|nr:MarC family protein [Thermoplasmatales archaeon]
MIEAFLATFIPLFIIVNPSSTLALFSAITSSYAKKDRKKTAKSAVIYAAILLVIFAIAGSAILEYLGIEIYSLRIAGGILLAFVGLDMTRRGQQFGESPPGKEQKADYALVPLAMPSLSGPGAITVIIVSMKIVPVEYNIAWWLAIIIAVIAILLTMIITYLIFLSSTFVIKALGKKGMDAFTRVMGLLTVAIAVQFMFLAIEGWLEVKGFL